MSNWDLSEDKEPKVTISEMFMCQTEWSTTVKFDTENVLNSTLKWNIWLPTPQGTYIESKTCPMPNIVGKAKESFLLKTITPNISFKIPGKKHLKKN